MPVTPKHIQRVYLTLILFNTLAASFIWGINTIFLLDAGLSNFEAFAANAFFSAGQVLFEVPTGVIADSYGRRASYLLGAFTLAVATLFYFYLWQIHAPFWTWAFSSALLGLGFTFFSGATEAWLVDALHATGFKGNLDPVFAKAQIVGGIAMLTGSAAGGIIAQVTNLGVPYIIRVVFLIITFTLAFFLMKDMGFTPQRGKQPLRAIKNLLNKSIQHGFKKPPVRWIMLAGFFATGISYYLFYALQPYLLQLYGDEKAYSVAGLIAALVAGAQIAGGFAAPFIHKLFKRRTSLLFYGTAFTSIVLLFVAFLNSFWVALILIFAWGLLFAALMPTRQAYLNGLIPSEQRATVLSFDSLMGSSGGIVIQPVLGKVADVWSYSTSYMAGALLQLAALPFIYLAKKENAPADIVEKKE